MEFPCNLLDNNENLNKVSRIWKEADNKRNIEEIQNLIQSLSPDQREHLKRITSTKCSAWLSANPWEEEYLAMTQDEFRDSMACRYGCGNLFDTNHALNCKNGGLVYQRHNELQDENCDSMKKAGFNQVICEPIVKEAGDNGLGELRGDWSVQGFWIGQKVAVFDTHILNAKAPSYKSLSPEAAFNIY